MAILKYPQEILLYIDIGYSGHLFNTVNSHLFILYSGQFYRHVDGNQCFTIISFEISLTMAAQPWVCISVNYI